MRRAQASIGTRSSRRTSRLAVPRPDISRRNGTYLMDPRRFDALSRSLASSTSRRGLIASLSGLGALLVGTRLASAQNGCPPGQSPNMKGDCSCPAGTDPCPDGCFDKKRDLNNCGKCGRSCAGGECRKGECRCPDGRRPSADYGCFDPPLNTNPDPDCNIVNGCGDSTPCSSGCSCGTTIELGGVCQGAGICPSESCASSAECGEGFYCIINTCCGHPFCAPRCTPV